MKKRRFKLIPKTCQGAWEYAIISGTVALYSLFCLNDPTPSWIPFIFESIAGFYLFLAVIKSLIAMFKNGFDGFHFSD